MASIAFDLDGVLADFFEKFVAIYNSRFHYTRAPLYLHHITEYKFHDCLPVEVADEIIKIFHEPGFFLNLNPLPGAIETVNKILSLGHVIEICTAPPSNYCPRAVMEKWEWIHQFFPALTDCITVTKNKFYLNTDMLVDDYPANLEKWCARHPKGLGYLIDAPWNQNFKDLPVNCIRGSLVDVPLVIREKS